MKTKNGKELVGRTAENSKPQRRRTRKGTRREGFLMAPKRKPAVAAERDPDGIFRGVSAFIVPHGVQARRLESLLCA